MSLNQNRILIFEPLSGGHRADFIRWLADEIPAYSGFRFVFFTAKDISEPMAQQLSQAGRWKKQRLLYSLFRDACRKHNPDHALILELTHLELPLALSGSSVPLSAILFIQYPELPRGLKFFFKHWKTALLLRRAPVKNLFLLNGEESCRFLSARFDSPPRFIPIPDPAPDTDADPAFTMRAAYGIEPGRKIFLFFGAISPRKGADVLINALHRLAPDAAAKSAFVFCGEPEATYRESFDRACAGLRAARPDVSLNTETRFVSHEQMTALFKQSDVVLMPYTRPEYSSGILAQAVKAKTPVIGPETGLLGRLIRENKLGEVCAVSPEPLAECIARAVEKSPQVDEAHREAFVQRSHPKLFARAILKAVCDER